MSEEEPKAAPAEGERDIRGILTEKPTQERWDDMKVRDSVGISVHVERNEEAGEAATRANRALNDIGDFIHQNKDGLRGLTYLGSAAVHIYCAETVGEAEFVCQTFPLRNTEERIAGPAFTQLQKAMMQAYAKKTTRLRSGF